MTLTIDQLTNGLTPDHDLVFPSRPENPEMRESTSVWVSDDAGRITFPRFGIEAEAHDWDNPLCTGNVCFPDGRVLSAIRKGAKPSPFGPDGRPTVLGAGPLSFHCIEPFRRWKVLYEGSIADGDVKQLIVGKYDLSRQIPFKLEFELELVTPAWVMDNPPEKVARMSEADRQEAEYMGVGWRCEHSFRGAGRYQLDGTWHEFTGTGLRVKRQSVRPMGGFRGHCWQSALFPDGRAFGYIAYPPRETDGRAYNEGYIYVDGRMHMGRVTSVPWLRRLIPNGDEAPFEIETDLGVTRIEGVTLATYYYRGHPGVADLDLQQAGVRYTWDGQTAYGMMERSSAPDLTTEG
jgi:hypothetical protein